MSFFTKVRLRWVDLDVQNHVNNAIIVDYLQQARIDFLLSGPLAHLVNDGAAVVGHQVEFVRPVLFDTEPVEVQVQVRSAETAAFCLHFLLRQHGEICAKANTSIAVCDVPTWKPQPLTASESAWLEAQVVPLEPFREVGGWEVGTAAFAADFVFRWSDLDTHSHVSDIRILDAMSETRVAMNPADSTIHRMQHAADLGYVWMVARQDVDYLAPVPHQLKPYQVRVGFAKLGRTSLTLVAVLEDKIENIPAGDVGKVYARCTTVLVCGDRNARPIPLPEDMRLGLKRWPAVPTSD